MTDIARITAETDWWKGFFHGIALDLWRAAVPEEATRAQAEFLIETLGLPSGARVLDVPCGNGRLALALAAHGYSMTGLDIAEEFIDEARSAAGSRALDIRWICGDMRRLPESTTFDGAFCWGNSFGYLDDAGNAEFLDAVGRGLEPGARFVIDYGVIAEALFPDFQEQRSFEVTGITMDIRQRYDPRRGRLHTEYTFIRDGHRDTRTGSQRVYSAGELCRMLERSGFEIEALYGGLDRRAFAIGSPHMVAVARRSVTSGSPS